MTMFFSLAIHLHSGHGHRLDGQCDEETRNQLSKVAESLKFLVPRIMLRTQY